MLYWYWWREITSQFSLRICLTTYLAICRTKEHDIPKERMVEKNIRKKKTKTNTENKTTIKTCLSLFSMRVTKICSSTVQLKFNNITIWVLRVLVLYAFHRSKLKIALD